MMLVPGLYYGPEFLADRFVTWCTERAIQTGTSQPGKPDQNALIERYNRTYRTEVLNAYVFSRSICPRDPVPNGCRVIMKSGP